MFLLAPATAFSNTYRPPIVTASSSLHPEITDLSTVLGDGDGNSYWHIDQNDTRLLHWLIFDYHTRRAVINRVQALPRTDVPEGFWNYARLVASNNAIVWTPLTDLTQPVSPRAGQWMTWNFPNMKAYRYYKIEVLSGWGFHRDFFSVADARLEEPTTDSPPSDLPNLSHKNPIRAFLASLAIWKVCLVLLLFAGVGLYVLFLLMRPSIDIPAISFLGSLWIASILCITAWETFVSTQWRPEAFYLGIPTTLLVAISIGWLEKWSPRASGPTRRMARGFALTCYFGTIAVVGILNYHLIILVVAYGLLVAAGSSVRVATGQSGEWMPELVTGLASMFIIILMMRGALLTDQTTLSHDVLYWIYPWYQFASESLLQGRIPWWNPFTHGGEPFYPLLAQLRLLDPTTFVVLFVGIQFTPDLLTIFAWDRFVRTLVFCLGTYALLRPWAEHTLTRCSLFPILLFSSFHLSTLRQDAISSQFIWAPWIILLLFRIVSVQDLRWHNWVLLGGLIGLNWQSYFFTGISIFVLLFIIGTTLYQPQSLQTLVRTPGVMVKLALTLGIAGAMCLPNIVLAMEQNRFVFPARMLDISTKHNLPIGGSQYWEPGIDALDEGSIVMPYEHVMLTGTFSNFLDFIQIINPFGNRFISSTAWGEASEAFMYFGLWVYAGAIWGVLAGQHPLKRVWLVIGIGFGLLMLGPDGGLHPLLYSVYPPLWFVRHTHAFSLFFSLAVLFFYTLGCNRLSRMPMSSFARWAIHASTRASILRISVATLLIVTAAVLTSDAATKIVDYLLGVQVEKSYFLEGKLAFNEHLDVKYRVSMFSLIRLTRIFSLCIGLWLFLGLLKKALSSQSLIWTMCPALLILSAFLLLSSVISLGENDLPLLAKSALILSRFALIGAGIWWMRKTFGSTPLFFIVVFTHFSTAILLDPRPLLYAELVLAIICVPLIILAFSIWKFPWNRNLIFPRVIFAVIVLDLLIFLSHIQGLWDWRRPDMTMGIQTTVVEPVWPTDRRLISEKSVLTPYTQSLRYIELATHTPTVFTSPIIGESSVTGASFAAMTEDELTRALIRGKRWNSFLMPHPYYRLLYADISPATLRAVFAVDRQLIQFKSNAIAASDSDGIGMLEEMGSNKSSATLENSFILSEGGAHRAEISEKIPDYKSISKRPATEGQETVSEVLVKHYSYNILDLTVASDKPGYLYWADGYDRYWKAYLNDLETPVLRANIAFKAVRLPSGSNRVRFVYDPIFYRMSVYIFVGLEIAVGLTAGLLWWRERNGPFNAFSPT